jgi:hypothetical protein
MTTTIKKIKATSYPVSNDTKKYLKSINALQYLPKEVPKDLSFELHNTTNELANGLKRCIQSEIPVLVMDFDKMYCDDEFVIGAELRLRVNLIPIRQISNMQYRLYVENKTDQIIPVFSKDIVVKGGSEDRMFSGTFVLTYLRPGKKITIEDIYVKSGISHKDGHVMYSFPGRVYYECLDTEELKKSSFMRKTQTYKLIIPKQKFVEPMFILKLALTTLIKKINTLEKIINSVNSDFHSSHTLNIETNKLNGTTSYHLFTETSTLGQMLRRYIYEEIPDIEYVNEKKIETTHSYVVIIIRYPDPKKAILIGLDRSKKELNSIMNSL